MEQHVLKCLDNIKFNENNILNGSIFTCKQTVESLQPCQNCLSCKLSILMNFSLSLLNHMTHQDVVQFIKNCSKANSQLKLVDILSNLLFPLKSKDRLYSLSRTVPSLNTDLVDFSMKNFTVNKNQLNNLTHRISEWIAQQPDTFRKQFILSLLSHLKVAVLSDIHRSICNDECQNISTKATIINSKEIDTNRTKDSITVSDEPIKDITDLNAHVQNHSINQISGEMKTDNYQFDLISILPIHISKTIINMLDETSLKVCSGLCENWRKIASQVRRENIVLRKIQEQATLQQSVTPTPADPTFARDQDVKVPLLDRDTNDIAYINKNKDVRKHKWDNICGYSTNEEKEIIDLKKVYDMETAYRDIVTKNVIIEERNVFCGTYSVMLIMESYTKTRGFMRTISFNGGQLVAVGGTNKIIQLIDVKGNQTDIMKNRIHGHAGSVCVIKIISKPGTIVFPKSSIESSINHKDAEILSGSFDTTVRRWDCISGKCLKIYFGHTSTITDIASGEEYFASGSLDGTCKIWQYNEKRCLHTMRHRHPVTAVAISDKLCISGDSSGLIKVWNIEDGKHIKDLMGHQDKITAVKMDKFHIVSTSQDCCAMVWSSVGKFLLCIGCFRHPKSVLCLEFMYLRAITGCEDGKIRIWNVLNSQCIRIIRGNSRSDPILNMIANGDTIVINTISNILVFQFEPVSWVYESDTNKSETSNVKSFISKVSDKQNSDSRSMSLRHLNQRCERSRFAGNIDPRIFLTPMTDCEKTNSKNHPTYLRSFENGERLTRLSTWIVSPTLNKNISIAKESQPISENKLNILTNQVNNTSAVMNVGYMTDQTLSSSGRRISYSFEHQDNIMCNVNLDQVKKTIRKHIRSPPQVSAEAMPDFIKTMVLQMKSMTMQRPSTALSLNPRVRPSSGPSKVDSKSKLAANEMRNVLTPLKQSCATPLPENENVHNLSEKPPSQSKHNKDAQKSLVTTTIKTSSPLLNNPYIVESFFVPTNYREKLQQKKLEFDQRHQAVVNVPLVVASDNTKQIKSKLFANNLNLLTYESSQQYLEQIQKLNSNYEEEKRKIAEEKHYQKWLKRATGSPVLKCDKDAIMKRPRSAKI